MKYLACLMALFLLATLSIVLTTNNDFSMHGGNWFLIIPASWLFGLLLGLTACALPIVLMMSSISNGGSKSWPALRTFAYITIFLTMLAIIYAIVGMTAALLGEYIHEYIQNTIVIVLFSMLFLFLGLSSLGLFGIMPAKLQIYSLAMIRKSRRLGSYMQAAVMGILSTSLASPCVTAPLIGALIIAAYVADIKFGGISFFIVGLGFGTPIITIYTIDRDLLMLQKSGEWQSYIKDFFGMVLIGASVFLLGFAISANILMYLWAALAVFVAAFMGAFAKEDKNLHLEKEENIVCSIDGEPVPEKKVKIKNISALSRMVSNMILIYGIILFIGALLGNENPFNPLKNVTQIVYKVPTQIGE